MSTSKGILLLAFLVCCFFNTAYSLWLLLHYKVRIEFETRAHGHIEIHIFTILSITEKKKSDAKWTRSTAGPLVRAAGRHRVGGMAGQEWGCHPFWSSLTLCALGKNRLLRDVPKCLLSPGLPFFEETNPSSSLFHVEFFFFPKNI